MISPLAYRDHVSVHLVRRSLGARGAGATATAIGLFVDGARMPVYLATGRRDIIGIWPLVFTAIVGVAIGTA